MRPKSKTRHAARPDQFLFGLGDDEMGAATREASDADNVLFLKSSSGWWVKRSEHQKLNSDGYAVGFRYELKQRNTTMDSGVGADTRRRFLALADLLNRQPPDPQNCPPAGQSLSGMTSKPEREPAKTSTSGGAAHDSGQEPTSLGFFSGAPPDERCDGAPPCDPPPGNAPTGLSVSRAWPSTFKTTLRPLRASAPAAALRPLRPHLFPHNAFYHHQKPERQP
jgi:hypothetical protein